VTPFPGVTLEVGGDVETYWKSMATPTRSLSATPARRPQRSRSIGSDQTSPSNKSQTGTAERPLTISSLGGNYVYLVVQVTRDFHPVIYADWILPESRFDINVADVTLSQFEAVARSSGRNIDSAIDTSSHDWHTQVSSSMISLMQLMKVGRFELSTASKSDLSFGRFYP
jgi:CDK inhibitor PHO81